MLFSVERLGEFTLHFFIGLNFGRWERIRKELTEK
jgi:hypothetical protein